jgi:hypothetical protein
MVIEVKYQCNNKSSEFFEMEVEVKGYTPCGHYSTSSCTQEDCEILKNKGNHGCLDFLIIVKENGKVKRKTMPY